MTNEELQILLESAQSGNHEAAKAFYKFLWTSEVYIPIKLNSAKDGDPRDNFIIVNYEDRKILPIFFSEDSLKEWGNEKFHHLKKEFKTLLWLTLPEIWLHYENGKEFGKEFSPWEIEQLKSYGLDALDEILNEVLGVNTSEVEISPLLSEDDALKQGLTILLESYPDIEEGFLIRAKISGEKHQRFVLGVKHNNLSEKKLEQFAREIEEFSEAKFENKNDLMLVGNLRWFIDTVPFYIKFSTKA